MRKTALNIPRFGPVSAAAFSLIELLTVVAILGVMMAASVPAFSFLKRTGDISSAAYDIASVLDQARSYAMANNTYVFVGFAERDQTDVNKAGVGQVVMAAMGSKNGSRSFGANNANLASLSRLRKLPNIRLAEDVPNAGGLARPAVQSAFRVANGAFSAQDSFTASGLKFDKIIQFDPRGMAAIQSSTVAVPQWMEIGLAGAAGSSENSAAVVVDGVTGTAKIYRP